MSNLNDSQTNTLHKAFFRWSDTVLDGKDVLVLEEHILIALDIERTLEQYGAGEVFLAHSAIQAQRYLDERGYPSLAIVEVGLNESHIVDLVLKLRARNVDVVLCAADTALRLGMAPFPDIPVLLKPMAENDFLRAIGSFDEVRN